MENATTGETRKQAMATANKVLLDNGIFPGPAWATCLTFAIKFEEEKGRWPKEKDIEAAHKKEMDVFRKKLEEKGRNFPEIWGAVINKIDA